MHNTGWTRSANSPLSITADKPPVNAFVIPSAKFSRPNSTDMYVRKNFGLNDLVVKSRVKQAVKDT
jgi:hypothetical protein